MINKISNFKIRTGSHKAKVMVRWVRRVMQVQVKAHHDLKLLHHIFCINFYLLSIALLILILSNFHPFFHLCTCGQCSLSLPWSHPPSMRDWGRRQGLDNIRGSRVMLQTLGFIQQHWGATEWHIQRVCVTRLLGRRICSEGREDQKEEGESS